MCQTSGRKLGPGRVSLHSANIRTRTYNASEYFKKTCVTMSQLRSCLLISAGHSKHANTRLYTVLIHGTQNSAENWHSAYPLFGIIVKFSENDWSNSSTQFAHDPTSWGRDFWESISEVLTRDSIRVATRVEFLWLVTWLESRTSKTRDSTRTRPLDSDESGRVTLESLSYRIRCSLFHPKHLGAYFTFNVSSILNESMFEH